MNAALQVESAAAAGVIELMNSLDDTARIRAMREIESEVTLEEAREVPLCDMNEAELCAVILHDDDKCERRKALHLLKQSLLLEAQTRTFNLLGEMSKERRK